jgi:hypothetical protein
VRRPGLRERLLRWYTGRQIPQNRTSGWQPPDSGLREIEAASLLAVSRSTTAQIAAMLNPEMKPGSSARCRDCEQGYQCPATWERAASQPPGIEAASAPLQIRPARIAVDSKVFTAVHPGEYGWPDKRLITPEQFEAAMAAAQKDGYGAACALSGIADGPGIPFGIGEPPQPAVSAAEIQEARRRLGMNEPKP